MTLKILALVLFVFVLAGGAFAAYYFISGSSSSSSSNSHASSHSCFKPGTSLDGVVRPDGKCGVLCDVGQTCRCDIGKCCSAFGYCGPDDGDTNSLGELFDDLSN
jgi:hypothetical protein